MKDNFVYLRHILEAIARTRAYIGESDTKAYIQNQMLQAALVREIEIIGEAAGKLPEEFRNAYPLIPWRVMISARNKMIHDYFGVDLGVVWDICTKDLPELEISIKNILPIEEERSGL